MKFVTATLALLGTAQAGITSTGAWSEANGPWYSDEHKLGVGEDGKPFSNDSETQRRISSPLNIEGDVDDYMTKENASRVAGIITEDQWEHLFPMRKDVYTREGFLKAVAKFPAFCDES
jgi:hypothetical protein